MTDRRLILWPILPRPGFPQKLVPKRIGVIAFAFEQQPGCLAAAGDGQFAARGAEPLVDGVDRQAEVAGHGFSVVAAPHQPQRLLLLFGQDLKAARHPFAPSSPEPSARV
jgi:hypothetical protein